MLFVCCVQSQGLSWGHLRRHFGIVVIATNSGAISDVRVGINCAAPIMGGNGGVDLVQCNSLFGDVFNSFDFL